MRLSAECAEHLPPCGADVFAEITLIRDSSRAHTRHRSHAESKRLRKECRDLVCVCAQALTLLDYLAKTGSERVAQQCRENAFAIQTLRDFQYVDRDGRDQGVNVREKAKQLVALLRDEERLRQERAQALKTKERMASGVPPAYPSRRSSQPSMNALYGEEFSRSRGSPSSFNSERRGHQGDDAHLQKVLEERKGERDPRPSEERRGHQGDDAHLQKVLEERKGERDPRPSESAMIDLVDIFGPADPWDAPPTCPVNSDPWESVGLTQIHRSVRLDVSADTPLHNSQSLPAVRCVLQLLSRRRSRASAVSVQERRGHQGDDAHLQKVLEERKGERDPRPSESAMIDLVDIFGPADPWDAPPTCPVNSDPWESVAVVKSSNPGADSPWTARPSSTSPAHPWGIHQSPPEPWDAPPSNSISNMDDEAWRSPARPVSSVKDPFSIPEEEGLRVEGEEPIVEQAGPNQVFSPRCESPADADQFGELVAGVQVNGRGNDSPETFDLSRLGPPLDAVTPRQCRTPKAFLGPTAASLVNLDTLIPSNAPVKNKNPFLSGLSTPSPTNPFHCEQPRLTLNQMRPHSTSPLPAHALSYSASLPLPVLQQRPQTLPSSYTQPHHGLLDIPSNLPQPLLPLTASTQQTQHPGQSQNPFL
ncbi:epsin-3-like [Sinocyclocheilus grahami]|uniref:epsin-3-like n=1 Tax=Sinocyclocheilus grahami TaxID=75366 RepID=UPI0007AC63A3|nr:PREDICTED: epsin-3-like [Sinocyclocheilus grahami]